MSDNIPLFSDRGEYYEISNSQRSLGWFRSRIGRITASTYGEVIAYYELLDREYSRFDTYVEPKILAAEICGLIKRPTTYPMIRGTQLEPEARDWFASNYGLKVTEPSMCTRKGYFHLGATPDGIFANMDKNILLEIKCPIKDYNISKEGLNYFKSNHYAQCQGQMFTTGIHNEYYLMYGVKGKYVEKINYDADFVENLLLPACLWFYELYVVPLMKQNNIIRIDPV